MLSCNNVMRLIRCLPRSHHLHLLLTLLSHVILNSNKIRCKPKKVTHPYEPFGGVIVTPLHPVSVIMRELVVIVVVAFSVRCEGEEEGGGGGGVIGIVFAPHATTTTTTT